VIMSGNEAWNRNVFKRWRKVDRDGADITLSGRLFQMVGPATGKARPPTVDSFTGGTSRRLVRAERRERRSGRSATQLTQVWRRSSVLSLVARESLHSPHDIIRVSCPRTQRLRPRSVSLFLQVFLDSAAVWIIMIQWLAWMVLSTLCPKNVHLFIFE